MLVLREGAEVESELDGGHLCCPNCAEPVSPWGWGRLRRIRTLEGERSLRPRRTRCGRCGACHIVLPPWAIPRRRDGAEVILSALLAKAGGEGHRAIAQRLGRPAATVRGWLRRGQVLAEAIRTRATVWAHALNPSLGAVEATGPPLADAMEAVGLAVGAAVRLLGPRNPFHTAVALTGGLLVPDG